MALVTRISRLFSADLHAVLDRVEEPGIVLKQAVRDMEAAVAATERRIRALRLQAEQIVCSRTSAEHQLRETGEELDVCLDADNDELARTVVQRKLQLERHLTALNNRSEHLHRALDEQERVLNRRWRELDTLRSKAESFDEAGPACWEAPTTTGASVSREEVEVALLREKQRRERS